MSAKSKGLRAIVEGTVGCIRHIQAEVVRMTSDFGIVSGKQIGACIRILNGPFSANNGKLVNGSSPVEHVAANEESVVEGMFSSY